MLDILMEHCLLNSCLSMIGQKDSLTVIRYRLLCKVQKSNTRSICCSNTECGGDKRDCLDLDTIRELKFFSMILCFSFYFVDNTSPIWYKNSCLICCFVLVTVYCYTRPRLSQTLLFSNVFFCLLYINK